MRSLVFASVLILALSPSVCLAGQADVVDAKAFKGQDGLWRFDVTVRHDDTGWNHYADRWDVLSPDGDVLATRVLAHPHVGEQPFTRSLWGVKLPEGLWRVRLRARDSLHGWGGAEVTLELEP